MGSCVPPALGHLQPFHWALRARVGHPVGGSRARDSRAQVSPARRMSQEARLTQTLGCRLGPLSTSHTLTGA